MFYPEGARGASLVTILLTKLEFLREVLGTVVTGAQRTFEMIEMDGGVDSLDSVSLGSWGDHGRLSEIAAVTLWGWARRAHVTEIFIISCG